MLHLDPDARRLARFGGRCDLANQLDEPLPEVERRDEHLAEALRPPETGDEVEEVGDVGGDVGVGREEPDVLVDARGRGVVVARCRCARSGAGRRPRGGRRASSSRGSSGRGTRRRRGRPPARATAPIRCCAARRSAPSARRRRRSACRSRTPRSAPARSPSRRLVRYTVVFSVDHVRVARGRPHERLDARRERVVRVLDDDVALRDLGEEVARRSGSRAGAVCTGPTARTSDRAGRARTSWPRSARSSIPRPGRPARARRRAAPASRVEHRARDRARDLERARRRRSAASAARDSTASSRSSASSEISVSPSRVSGTRRARRSPSPGRATAGSARSRPRAGAAGRASPTATKRGKASRHLDAREALLARLGVADEHAEAQRQPRDVRERLPGPDGERRQHRVDLAAEHVAPARRARRRRASSTAPIRIPSAASAGHELVAPQAATAPP